MGGGVSIQASAPPHPSAELGEVSAGVAEGNRRGLEGRAGGSPGLGTRGLQSGIEGSCGEPRTGHPSLLCLTLASITLPVLTAALVISSSRGPILSGVPESKGTRGVGQGPTCHSGDLE